MSTTSRRTWCRRFEQVHDEVVPARLTDRLTCELPHCSRVNLENVARLGIFEDRRQQQCPVRAW